MSMLILLTLPSQQLLLPRALISAAVAPGLPKCPHAFRLLPSALAEAAPCALKTIIMPSTPMDQDAKARIMSAEAQKSGGGVRADSWGARAQSAADKNAAGTGGKSGGSSGKKN